MARSHYLDRAATAVNEVADGLVGLHASDPVTVYLSLRARVQGFVIADLETALYDDRSLVRMLGMRRTMFVVPTDLAAVMDASCTKALGPPQRRLLTRMLEEQDVAGDGLGWLERVESETLAALTACGEATLAELKKEIPELGLTLRYGNRQKWAGEFGLGTRVLFLLATDARVIRGRPLGSWKSSLYRWAPTAAWIGRPLEALDEKAASIDLVNRWLRSYGPGTFTDLKWWTGWTVTKTRATLAAAGAIEVQLDEGTGYMPADGPDTPPDTGSWVALLPGLDPSVMGWKERRWLLGEHEPALFDRNGNAGASAWVDGRIVGAWAQRPDGEIVLHLVEDVGADATAALEAEAAHLSAWLGPERVKPRFRTPLDKQLTG
ncbi:MAG: winged helix DNA-binding domain-containing protein [Acidimicrobiia bacterium]|nr:winged helix DNA-binding domain-containing protein [Acidimicrobiia bacterium]